MSSTSDSQFFLEPIGPDSGSVRQPEIPILDIHSSGPIPIADYEPPQPPQPPQDPEDEADLVEVEVVESSSVSVGGFWLNGNAVFAACPDCGAPISIRLWLMLADCWNCGACIELTEEQERQVRELLEKQKREAPAERATKPATQQRRESPKAPEAKKRDPQQQEELPKAAPLVREKRSAPQGPAAEMRKRGAQRQRHRIRATNRTTAEQARANQRLAEFHGLRRNTRVLNAMPAWLISLLVHLIILLLLAIWQRPMGDNEPEIVLSLRVGPMRTPGGETGDVEDEARLAFDLPLPEGVDENDPDIKDEIMHDREDAAELLMNPNTHAPEMAKISEVRKMLGSKSPRRVVAARDPRIRAEVLRKEGGTTRTEAAVARGLRWLASQQKDDGRWKLSRPGDRFSSRVRSDAGATSLALLPFLGAGQTHRVGKYKQTVGHGLQWLISHQNPRTGFLGGGSDHNAQAYAHGQATIVLCEAFTMTGDEVLRKPAQMALDYIVKIQGRDGGWRYSPGQTGDTSVLGWQVMALKSGKTAGLRVPDSSFERAGKYLDGVSYLDNSLYAYNRSTLGVYTRHLDRNQDGVPASESMSSEGLLCRIYLGWNPRRQQVSRGLRLLQENFPIGPATAQDPDADYATTERFNMYYIYYATQAYKQYGGNLWSRWNRDMQRLLVNSQISQGPDAGSWVPSAREAHDRSGGRLYMTSLAVCCLEVYYRYLPIFQRED